MAGNRHITHVGLGRRLGLYSCLGSGQTLLGGSSPRRAIEENPERRGELERTNSERSTKLLDRADRTLAPCSALLGASHSSGPSGAESC
jgi:hypothetical protein